MKQKKMKANLFGRFSSNNREKNKPKKTDIKTCLVEDKKVNFDVSLALKRKNLVALFEKHLIFALNEVYYFKLMSKHFFRT